MVGVAVLEEEDDVGVVIAAHVALSPGGGAESMHSAPSGGWLRLSLQLPGCRTLLLQRRMKIGRAPCRTREATLPVHGAPGAMVGVAVLEEEDDVGVVIAEHVALPPGGAAES